MNEDKLSYAKRYPSAANQSQQALGADILVIGAGIAGASIVHYASSSHLQARVLVVEQYDFNKPQQSLIDSTKNKHASSHTAAVVSNPGSSRGGPRRIGTLGGDERTQRSWKQWLQLQQSSSTGDVLDVSGEVYTVRLFPFGWIVVGGIWIYYNVFRKDKQPQGLKFLWTPQLVENTLGSRQGFRPGCWKGNVGVFHQEAAVLHTDKILKYFLQPSKNLEVRYGAQVTDIEMMGGRSDDDNEESRVVKVSILDEASGQASQVYCRHVVIAAGGWTGDILKRFYQTIQLQPELAQPIKTKIQVFSCPIYKIHPSNDGTTAPPPFSLESGCPIFSCISQKVYGFPINHGRLMKSGEEVPLCLPLRPFNHGSENDDNPADETVSTEQLDEINAFCRQHFTPTAIEYSHCYTCRYPKLCLNGENSYKPVLDFVPHTNQQLVVCAGLDGYGFKFGSIYGMEFVELLETGQSPNGMEWPSPKEATDEGWIKRMIRAILVKFVESPKPNTNGSKDE